MSKITELFKPPFNNKDGDGFLDNAISDNKGDIFCEMISILKTTFSEDVELASELVEILNSHFEKKDEKIDDENLFDTENTDDLPEDIKRLLKFKDSTFSELIKQLFHIKNTLTFYELMAAFYRRYRIKIDCETLNYFLRHLINSKFIIVDGEIDSFTLNI